MFNINLYLLTIRSPRKTAMFATKADYQYCLQRLSKLKHDYQVDIRGFCLTPNYLKLVLGLNASEINKELVVLCPSDQLVVWKKIKNILPRSRLLKGQCVRIADHRRLNDVLEYIECESVQAGIVPAAREYRYCSSYH